MVGCTRAIKETVGVVSGPKGVVVPLEPVGVSLGQYTNFEIGQVVDDFGGKTPRELIVLLPGEFRKQLVARKLPMDDGGKTLELRIRVLHYENEGTVGKFVGPLEEVLARVQMVDKQTGQVLGVANCIGRTQESVNLGVQKKAEGLAKALASWVERHYPKPAVAE